MVKYQPALRGFYRGWRKANLVGIPPSSSPSFHHEFVTTPVNKIGRVRDPHVGSGRTDWTMDQRPATVDAMRQQGCVLILRRHDDAIALEFTEICGSCQGYSRSIAREGCVDHDELIQFRDICNARVLDSPDFFWEVFRVRQQGGLLINSPAV